MIVSLELLYAFAISNPEVKIRMIDILKDLVDQSSESPSEEIAIALFGQKALHQILEWAGNVALKVGDGPRMAFFEIREIDSFEAVVIGADFAVLLKIKMPIVIIAFGELNGFRRIKAVGIPRGGLLAILSPI